MLSQDPIHKKFLVTSFRELNEKIFPILGGRDIDTSFYKVNEKSPNVRLLVGRLEVIGGDSFN